MSMEYKMQFKTTNGKTELIPPSMLKAISSNMKREIKTRYRFAYDKRIACSERTVVITNCTFILITVGRRENRRVGVQ